MEMVIGATIMLVGILVGWGLARVKFDIEDEQ
jgi:hypothetical protein